jgi:hypothetical protein
MEKQMAYVNDGRNLVRTDGLIGMSSKIRLTQSGEKRYSLEFLYEGGTRHHVVYDDAGSTQVMFNKIASECGSLSLGPVIAVTMGAE